MREVTLAFRQSDRVAEILVDEGDLVKAGQLLVRLDNRGLFPHVPKIWRKRRQAEQAILHDAEQHYNRIQKVYDDTDGNAITRDELTTARLIFQNKSAQLEKARQEFLLSQYELTAPTDGVIRSRLLEVGDMASSSVPIFKISLNDKKWIRAYVNETDLGKVFEGQAAQVYIDSFPNESISGQIGYISSTAEFTPKTVQTDELRTSLVYAVRVYVSDPKNILRLGMPATVEIDLK